MPFVQLHQRISAKSSGQTSPTCTAVYKLPTLPMKSVAKLGLYSGSNAHIFKKIKSRLKSAGKSITHAQVSQSIDNRLSRLSQSMVRQVSRSYSLTPGTSLYIYGSLKLKLHLARHDTTRPVRHVGRVETSVSIRARLQLDTAKVRGLDTSNVSCRVEMWRDEPSGICA